MTEHVPSASTDGRVRTGCWFFILPVVFAAVIFGTYLVLFGVGSLGSAASGERVTIDFQTCAEARPLIEARVAQMGLGTPVYTDRATGFSLTANLPDSPAAPHIPATLARAGDFHIRQGTEPDGAEIVGPDAVKKAELTLKELGNPLVEVLLSLEGKDALEAHMEAHVDDQISVWIDVERVFVRDNDPPFRSVKLDLRAEGDDGVDNLRRAADWGMVVSHGPLPCSATVAGVRPAQE